MRIGAVLRAYRRRKLSQLPNKGMISAHFNQREFWCHDGTAIPIVALPGLKRHAQRFLEPMRERFGACHVMSGYRHEVYNRDVVHGAKDSRHDWDKHPYYGVATDLIFATGTPVEWARHARGLRNIHGFTGGIGTYTKQGFIHLDSRDYRADWGT